MSPAAPASYRVGRDRGGVLRPATRALHRALSPTFPAGRWCSLSLGEGAPKTRARGASRPARAAWLVQRLLTAGGDVAGGAGELPGRSRSRWGVAPGD